MRNKIITLIILLLFASGLSKLQAQQAVLSSGGNTTSSDGSVSYSIGQIFNATYSTANGSVNQGVQQPFEFFPVGTDNNIDIILSIFIYPNPTSDFIKLEVESEMYTKLSYRLVNSHGKLLSSQKISSSITVVPMERLPPASYFLYVNDNKTGLKTFKIIKN
ncbi:MAG: T9SS type A sorting domain-containing protein [Chlorobi bacterium]|nr:T9SS type A sorting domain-containing protein [Chlorobiota bacterium]